jgi:divalent metal cation (Fe/Co/Zn/Cd) transporter
MKVLGWLKALLSVVFAAAIGLAVTGVGNLLHPAENIGWAIGTVVVASVLSALAAFFVTQPRKKTPAPAAPKDAKAGDQKS